MSSTSQEQGISVLGHTEVRHLHSSIVGDDFRIFIAHPPGPSAPGNPRLPVIFALDGNTSFGITVDTVRLMSFEALVPPALIVGIGYKCPWIFNEAYAKRSRDYTPSKLPVFDRLGTVVLPNPEEAGELQTGGAASFLRFITEELNPYLAAEFNADVEDNLIFGVSLGGLFATWVLLTKPETFKRYLICSPSLWWDKESMIKLGEELLETGEDLKAKVYMGCGALEKNENFQQMFVQVSTSKPAAAELYSKDGILDNDGELKMAEYFDGFVQKLQKKGFPNLRMESKVFDNESHCSVAGSVLSQGLRFLFKTE